MARVSGESYASSPIYPAIESGASARPLSHPPSTLAGMSFQPYLTEPTPCWYCTGFGGMTAMATCALCSRPLCPRVRSSPETGCSQFVRVVGVDDEPWSPTAAVLASPRGLEPPPVPWAP